MEYSAPIIQIQQLRNAPFIDHRFKLWGATVLAADALTATRTEQTSYGFSFGGPRHTRDWPWVDGLVPSRASFH